MLFPVGERKFEQRAGGIRAPQRGATCQPGENPRWNNPAISAHYIVNSPVTQYSPITPKSAIIVPVIVPEAKNSRKRPELLKPVAMGQEMVGMQGDVYQLLRD